MGRCGGTAALLTGLGGEVGWALRPKQPLEDGTNLYQKPTPKQDKGGGINPPPMALACGLENDAAGGECRPAAFRLPPLARLQRAGNPRLGVMEMWKGIWRNPLQPDHKYVIILL